MEEHYTHRNGETDEPTIEGPYWFNGVQKWEGREVSLRDWLPSVEPDSRSVYFIGDEMPDDLSNYIGRWWGPIVLIPPWEDK